MDSKLKGALALIMLIAVPAFVLADNPKTADNPSVETVLAGYVDALGGTGAIQKLSTRSCTGRVVTDLSSGQHPIYQSSSFETHCKAPTNWSYQVWSDDGGYREGFDGEVGWARDRCGTQTDARLKHNKLAFLLNPQGVLHVDGYFPGLTYAGESEVNGTSVHALRPDSLPPEHYTLYFSKETGLLVAIGNFWTVEDYRVVDGVKCPHRIATSRKGGSTTYELLSVTHNADLSNSTFVIPKEAD